MTKRMGIEMPAVTLEHGDSIQITMDVYLSSLEGALLPISAKARSVQVKRDGEDKYKPLPPKRGDND